MRRHPCQPHSNPPARLALVVGLLGGLSLTLLGCTDTTRPDASPAPVEDHSIESDRQPARTVSRASDVVPLQPPRAEPTPRPKPVLTPVPAPKAAEIPHSAPASDPSQWPPPPMVEAAKPTQRRTTLPGDPDYHHERIEIGSAVNINKSVIEPKAEVNGQRELPPLALARPEPIRPEKVTESATNQPAKAATPAATPATTPATSLATQVAKRELEPMAARPQGDKPPAVAALLAEANRQMRAGNDDAAAASLERALRVEPRDAFLWYRLAYVRLRQGRASDAESLALKSNSLAGDKLELVDTNWRLIARARRQQNDAAGAAEAEANLR